MLAQACIQAWEAAKAAKEAALQKLLAEHAQQEKEAQEKSVFVNMTAVKEQASSQSSTSQEFATVLCHILTFGFQKQFLKSVESESKEFTEREQATDAF